LERNDGFFGADNSSVTCNDEWIHRIFHSIKIRLQKNRYGKKRFDHTQNEESESLAPSDPIGTYLNPGCGPTNGSLLLKSDCWRWSDVRRIELVGSKIFGPGPDLFSNFGPGPCHMMRYSDFQEIE